MVPHAVRSALARTSALREVACVPVPQATVVASITFIVGSIVPVAAILAFPVPAVRAARAALLANWREAAIIAALYEVSSIVRGRALDLTTLAIFAWAIVGLTIARGIPGFEPLRVVGAIGRRARVAREIALTLLLAIALNFIAKAAGGLGMSIGHALTGETSRTAEVASTFPSDPVQSFFLLLGGAGIAEETLFRLVVLSAIWKVTGSAPLAVLASAVVFGAYHLSPLDGLYEMFWTFPVSQLIASTFTGIVWGIAYVKRGYETAVLGHTLGDWLTILIFLR
jgi:membrane protease YdiL (CAAX protease family)